MTTILFPHTHINNSDLKRILPLFGQITICQPWFMDPPQLLPEYQDPSLVDIIQPPVNLKPKKDFRRLLSEYQHWIRHNQDKGYADFLKMAGELASSEDTLWELRQIIRDMGKDSSAEKENYALKWHLILHLAREIEESSAMAVEMLMQARQQKSPLEEALGEGSSLEDFFKDLPPLEIPMDEDHLRQVFEAWFGLFGKSVHNHDFFLTLNSHVMNYVTDIFEHEFAEASAGTDAPYSPEPKLSQNDIIRRHFPRLPNGVDVDRDSMLAGLSGKTVFLLKTNGPVSTRD